MTSSGAPSRQKPWTVFVDRDGTLVVDQVRGVDIAKLQLRSGAKEALQLWKDAGWRIVGVTNNSGLARGLYSEAQMHAFHRAIEAQTGVKLDAWYFCPHLPDAGCACRKPKTGMFDAAIRDLGIDPKRCFMVGDTTGDMGAGAAIGAKTIFIPAALDKTAPADFIGADLFDAARWSLAVASKA